MIGLLLCIQENADQKMEFKWGKNTENEKSCFLKGKQLSEVQVTGRTDGFHTAVPFGTTTFAYSARCFFVDV